MHMHIQPNVVYLLRARRGLRSCALLPCTAPLLASLAFLANCCFSLCKHLLIHGLQLLAQECGVHAGLVQELV